VNILHCCQDVRMEVGGVLDNMSPGNSRNPPIYIAFVELPEAKAIDRWWQINIAQSTYVRVKLRSTHMHLPGDDDLHS
jgi:hypothetical protein